MKSSLFTAFRLLLTTSSLATYNLIACLLLLRHLALTTSSLIPYSLLYTRARGNDSTIFAALHQTACLKYCTILRQLSENLRRFFGISPIFFRLTRTFLPITPTLLQDSPSSLRPSPSLQSLSLPIIVGSALVSTNMREVKPTTITSRKRRCLFLG